MHDLAVIATLTGALAAALVLGALTQRLGLSTLVGYILAGVVVGPFTPGFVADARLAPQMAEIGVILLMFTVGMHFHPQELLRVRRIAVPGAIGQSVVACVAGWACRARVRLVRCRGRRVRHGARGGEHGRAHAHAGAARTGSPAATGQSPSAG